MRAEELIQAGNIEAALADLQDRVRKNPADSSLRVFLFQLMALLGQWERAASQLQIVQELDQDAWPMVHAYRDAINCERHREAVFQGQVRPLVLGQPEEWMAQLIEAQQAFAHGELSLFEELNTKAFEQAPAISGKINDEPFEWLADADQRFGPVLEVVFNSQYYWAPFSAIKALRSEAPTDLRDLIWLPAEATWSNGGKNMVLIPARYPLVSGVSNEHLLARKTDWVGKDNEVPEGIGQRMLITDQSDYPLLQVRSIELDF